MERYPAYSAGTRYLGVDVHRHLGITTGRPTIYCCPDLSAPGRPASSIVHKTSARQRRMGPVVYLVSAKYRRFPSFAVRGGVSSTGRPGCSRRRHSATNGHCAGLGRGTAPTDQLGPVGKFAGRRGHGSLTTFPKHRVGALGHSCRTERSGLHGGRELVGVERRDAHGVCGHQVGLYA